MSSCHTTRQVGQVFGVIDITYPVSEFNARLVYVLNTVLGCTALMLATVFAVRYLTRGGARTRYVYGHDMTTDEGRVSSAIIDFKMESMTVTTASGSRYRLTGLPGHSKKAQALWDEWCRTHLAAQRDVSNDYISTR